MAHLSGITPIWVLRTQAVDGVTTKDVLFSNVDGWFTAVGDTPANTGVFGGLQVKRATMNRWTCIDTSEFLDIGGVVKIDRTTYSVNNKRNPGTKTRPLDTLEGYAWRGELAELWIGYPTWSTANERWEVPAFSTFTRLWTGEIRSQSASGNNMQFSVKQQIDVDMEFPITPVVWPGLGGKLTLEKLSGDAPVVERADHSALRALGDQTYSVMAGPVSTPSGSASSYIITTPLFRIVIDETGGTNGHMIARLLNNSSAFQDVGNAVEVPTAGKRKTLMVTYNLSTTLASLFVDGVADGTTTITGGLDSGAASGATKIRSWNAFSTEWGIYFARHLDEELTDTEDIGNFSLYGLASGDGIRCTMALEFSDRLSVGGLNSTGVVTDFAATGGIAAEIKNHTDIDASWGSAYLGEAAMARTRPAAIIQDPYHVPLEPADLAFGYYTAGYEGDLIVRSYRHITNHGVRLKPEFSTSATPDFTAGINQIDNPIDSVKELAARQVVSFTGGTANNGNKTVAVTMLDPVVGSEPSYRSTPTDMSIIVEETLTTETGVGYTAASVTPDWDDVPSVLNHDFVSRMRFVEVTTATEKLAGSLSQNSVTNFSNIAEYSYENLGPERTVVTKTSIETAAEPLAGWRALGTAKAGDVMSMLAKNTLSTDGGPSAVFTKPNGDPAITGSLLSPASQDWTWIEDDIDDIEEVTPVRTVYQLVIRYAKSHSPADVQSNATLAQQDEFFQQSAQEWREVTAGSGNAQAIVETSFLRNQDAKAWGGVLFDWQDARLFRIRLYGPHPAAALLLEPFHVANVTHSRYALLAAARGLIVGAKIMGNAAIEVTCVFHP